MKTISNFFFKRTQPEEISATTAEAEGPLEIVEVAMENIVPNPFQPRKTFSEEGLAELAASIKEFGVIQPLLVRKSQGGYEVIAGERRLRASKIAGLAVVPCVTRQASDKEMAEIAMIENLQREDLHYFEEAAGYEKLLTDFDLTQDELAKRVGKDQSTIANKLRLLKLAPELRELIFQKKLTERHSRALLRLPGPEEQNAVLQTVVEKQMNVRETEALIEERLQSVVPKTPEVRRPQMLKIVKDVRIFINTVGELVKQMKKVGLDVRLIQEQDEDTVTITMVVPKRR